MVIAESTRRLLGNLFELQDLGEQRESKVLQARCEPGRRCGQFVEGRFEAMHASGLTALVGREEEPEFCCAAGPRQRAAKGK